MGLTSLIGDTVRGACSPMLPSLPSRGIAEPKADACMTWQLVVLPQVHMLTGSATEQAAMGCEAGRTMIRLIAHAAVANAGNN